MNQDQDENQSDDEGSYEAKSVKGHGSTLRKVSITCIEKLSQSYQDIFWQNSKILISMLLRNESDFKIQYNFY